MQRREKNLVGSPCSLTLGEGAVTMRTLTAKLSLGVVLLVGEASGVFAGFCPSWFTVASPFLCSFTSRRPRKAMSSGSERAK